MSIKHGLITIIIQLAVLDEVSKRLRKSLEVNQKLLVLLNQMKILLRAHQLVQKERVLLVRDLNKKRLWLICYLKVQF